ncbi:MAG: hypothetical protein MUD01_22590, partial [Chloroflexaceae bacterium]|nr:hypothetical protein [Chloroflexaceae bacterium]
ADQRLYRQLRANTPPNNNGCASGCGPTAWAMLYGWVDVQAQKPGSQWAGKQGIYQVNGGRGTGAAVAPRTNDAGVANMTMEIRGYTGTFCAGSQGPTLPWRMLDAWRYANGRAGMRFRTSWTVPYIGNRADEARNAIVNRRSPAIIGTGFYAHYPMAYAYAERTRRVRRCFIFCWYDNVTDRALLANQGQGGGGNGWIGYDSWFVGEVFPR